MQLLILLFFSYSYFIIAANVLQLPASSDFEVLHCQPSTNFDISTKLDLTTEPPLAGRYCYLLAFLTSVVLGNYCKSCRLEKLFIGLQPFNIFFHFGNFHFLCLYDFICQLSYFRVFYVCSFTCEYSY